MKRALFMVAAAALLQGCIHVAGMVEEEPGRPMASAELTVGRPDGISVMSRHPVDRNGRFDFMLMRADENNLYIHDSRHDPRLSVRRIDSTEISDHMRLSLRSATPEYDMGGPGVPGLP